MEGVGGGAEEVGRGRRGVWADDRESEEGKGVGVRGWKEGRTGDRRQEMEVRRKRGIRNFLHLIFSPIFFYPFPSFYQVFISH